MTQKDFKALVDYAPADRGKALRQLQRKSISEIFYGGDIQRVIVN